MNTAPHLSLNALCVWALLLAAAYIGHHFDATHATTAAPLSAPAVTPSR